MLMNYALLDIPRINPNYASRCDFKANRVICSAAGQIKILNCDPAILTEVLQNVDGNTAFGEIERRFCDRYPLESIRSFLNILLEEGIIEKAEDKPHSLKHANVLVIGEGSIFNSIVSCSGSNSHLSTVDFLTTDSPINYDAAIFAPGIATNEEMLAVNKKLYYIDKPFIAFFCNGEKLVAGPLVVPGKSACLECVLSHEIKWLNSKLSKDARIKTQDVLSLRFSCELPSTTSKEVLAYISSCVMTDLEKYNNGDVSVFLDKQFYFELNEPKYTVERVNPTTSCDFCSGMNKKYVRFDPENTDCVSLLNELLIEDAPELTKRNIKYRVGGFRSASETETMSILQTELKKFGAKVRVEPAIGNPFNDSDTIHCFNSFIEQTSNAEIPFLFRKNEGAGKGLTETQSFFSAAFELLEHAGLQYAGDVPIVCAKYKDVQNVAIDMPYLASMIKNPNTAFDNFDENEEIDWVVATSVTDGSHKLVPAFMAFLYDVELKGTLYAASSNGAAIATSVEDAILHGLLESIERDAWLGSVTALIVTKLWWAAVLMVLLSIPILWVSLWAGKRNYEAKVETRKYEHRYSYYSDEVLCSRDAAQERALFEYSDKITDRYYEYFKISSNIELKVLLNTRLVTKATRPPCIAVPVCAGVPIRSCRVPPCSVLTCFVCRRRVPSHRERCRRSFGC